MPIYLDFPLADFQRWGERHSPAMRRPVFIGRPFLARQVALVFNQEAYRFGFFEVIKNRALAEAGIFA